MKATRLSLSVLLGGAVLVALSCAEPTAPAPRSSLLGGDDTLGELKQITGLLQCEPLPYDSVTQTIGPLGGVIQVGPHSLTIPAGALDSDVTITAVTPPDTVNRIQFQPEGLVFNGFTDLRMSYANCNLLGSILPKRVVYTTPDLLILDYLPSLDDGLTQTVRGKLLHFSDYAIAW
jgi:hypothetical protein